MKPILFNTEMVQAILEGRKTVTRRVVKPKYKKDEGGFQVCTNKATGERWVEKMDWEEGSFDNPRYVRPPYQVGDILYVRETWTTIDEFENYADSEIDKDLRYLYKCDDNGKEHPFIDVGVKKWKPSIHMPKAAARIFLKVTDVRVERLQDICKDYSNFNKEGIIEEHGFRSEMHRDFIKLWNSTVKKQNLDKYGWGANPWVWVVEFEKGEV